MRVAEVPAAVADTRWLVSRIAAPARFSARDATNAPTSTSAAAEIATTTKTTCRVVIAADYCSAGCADSAGGWTPSGSRTAGSNAPISPAVMRQRSKGSDHQPRVDALGEDAGNGHGQGHCAENEAAAERNDAS